MNRQPGPLLSLALEYQTQGSGAVEVLMLRPVPIVTRIGTAVHSEAERRLLERRLEELG
ncbi:MAG: hypothetical protein M3O77_07925 [Chloroflexota bacterium]|nr:hypothetical protein [Chloroflexota bacterium]